MRIRSLLALIPLFATPALGAGQSPSRQLTTDQREQLAKVAADLAKCLRSDKPYDTCVNDAASSCFALGELCPLHHHRGHQRAARPEKTE